MLRKKNILLYYSWLILGMPLYSSAQNPSFAKNKEQAILNLSRHDRQDTARVNALLAVVYTAIFFKERKELLPYLEEGLSLSRRLSYTKGLANCYMQKGNYHKSASDYKNALLYYDSTIRLIDEKGDDQASALREWALEQKGSIYYAQENYYMALDYYFEALRNLPESHRARRFRIYKFMTEIYTLLNNLESATEYALKNISMLVNDTDRMNHATAYLSYIDVCLEKKDLETASLYLDKMSPYVPDPNEVQVNYGYYIKRGRVCSLRGDFGSAYDYFKEGYKYAIQGGHINSKSVSLYFLARTALQLGYDEIARDYSLQNLALTEHMDTRSARVEALMNLSSYYSKTGKKEKAYQTLREATLLKDSLVEETNHKQINVLGAIYEYDKQQKQIINLENERRLQAAAVKQQSLLNNLFIGSIIVILFISYLGYLNFRRGKQLYRQRQALQEQKILDLEKDRQLVAVDAMLKGQEEERGRIAKDLHDGIGSLLSGTKLSFMNVRESMALDPSEKELFEKSLAMLDTTIVDLRKVAQNLMPEALVKFGLGEALRDFCDSIEWSTGIRVVYQNIGEKRTLDNTAEVFIYRIVQELVNNAVKHAEASEIFVQVSSSKDKIILTVEDDGKGFDLQQVTERKGAGLSNIRSRVEYFNGTCDVVTSPGHGTSINIELIA